MFKNIHLRIPLSDVHNEIEERNVFFFSILFCLNQMVFWHILNKNHLKFIYLFIYFFL